MTVGEEREEFPDQGVSVIEGPAASGIGPEPTDDELPVDLLSSEGAGPRQYQDLLDERCWARHFGCHVVRVSQEPWDGTRY